MGWTSQTKVILLAVFDERSHFWAYDSAEFELPNNSTDYDLATNQSTIAFNKVTVANDVLLRTDRNISFKVNSANNATITLSSTEGELSYSNIKTSNLYLTNTSGATANIKILLSGR